MLDGSKNLMQLLRGDRVEKPPFWEVWFTMYDFCRRNYGDYNVVDNRISMALDLGMDAVLLGGIDTDVHFGSISEAGDGSAHYAGGSLCDWSQIEERGAVPNWESPIEGWISDRSKIRDAGLACWMILPWCFHAVATSMGLSEFALRCYDELDFVKSAMAWVEGRNREAIRKVIAEVHCRSNARVCSF